MKQLTKKNKIIYGIILLIIIVGIIIVINKGFNVGLEYRPYQKVEIYLGKEFDKKDIKNITDEVFGKEQVSIKKVELFEDMVSISSNTISEEQKNDLVQKINEKYELSVKEDDTEIISVSNIKLTDLSKKYIYPIVLSFVIILVYMFIRFAKINSLKVILETILKLIIVELLIISVLAITRIAVGIYTLPVILISYVLTIIYFINKFERQLEQKVLEEEKE